MRLELRRQVQVEDVDFVNYCFISIDAMGMDEITQSIHRMKRGNEKGNRNKKQSLVGMCYFQLCSIHSFFSGALPSFIFWPATLPTLCSSGEGNLHGVLLKLCLPSAPNKEK